MPLPSSGQLSLGDLRNEFGGGNPVYMSQMYRGAGLVPNTPQNANIPTSGTIYLSQFYGASAAQSTPLSVSAPNVYQQINSGTATGSSVATPSGGSGSYPSITWTNNSTATMSVSGARATFTATRSGQGSATARVQDSAGAVATRTITVDLTVGRPV